ncbi:MAG: hypothetical protein ACP5M7_10125, partial [Thermoproteota archaeon]
VRRIVEEIFGPTNPNTLAFHIKKLVESGLMLRKGSPESPKYVADVSNDVKKEIEKIAEVLKDFKGGDDNEL